MPNEEEDVCNETNCFFGFFIFIIIGIFLISSLSFVEPINYGLVCNRITKLCDTQDGNIY